MRWHSNGRPAHPNAKPFTNFIAERQVMDVADLNVTLLMPKIGHDELLTFGPSAVGARYPNNYNDKWFHDDNLYL
jgi:hypothetical protein